MNTLHSFSKEELIRYSQQLKLENVGLEGQKKLKNARVLCVGAGGLGSPLLLYLAAAGVGTLGVVDFDMIEMSNFHRQILFQQQHLGMKKSSVALQQLNALNPTITVNVHDESFDFDNATKLLEKYDIIADCSDNFKTRYLINDICFQNDKPYVSASIARYSGQCSFFLGKNNPCFRCLYPEPPSSELFPDCRDAGVLGVLPGILGTIQATEIIKWILQVGELLVGRLFIFDALKMQSREFTYSINCDCGLHKGDVACI